MPLDIHVATDDERVEAFANVFDVWAMAPTVDEHVERRLASVQHSRAEWYVGCLDGQVVTSLACYPLEFYLHGEIVAGIAIGSVHTLAEHRRCRFAAQLIEWVEAEKRNRGAAISMLYSDVDPNYYARMGYQLCPSHCGWQDFASVPQDAGACNWHLVQFDPADELSQLEERYAAFHGLAPLAVARALDYWQHTLDKGPRHQFYWLKPPDDAAAGYVRVAIERDRLKLLDYALAADEPENWQAMYRNLVQLAASKSLAHAGGWLPDLPAARELFRIEPRRQELTMLKALDSQLVFTDSMLAAVDRFCEIDHV